MNADSNFFFNVYSPALAEQYVYRIHKIYSFPLQRSGMSTRCFSIPISFIFEFVRMDYSGKKINSIQSLFKNLGECFLLSQTINPEVISER